jgi:hypothetical protein
MALSDIKVYNREVYDMRTELLNEQIELFNSATNGGIMLRTVGREKNQGSFNSSTFWKKLTTVRRRNAAAMTAISDVVMTMGEDVSVKVAAGSNRLLYEPGDMDWIGGKNRDATIAAFAKQLAKEHFSDFLKAAFASYIAATGNVAAVLNNVTAVTGVGGMTTPETLLDTKYLFGDATDRIVCWVMTAAAAKSYIKNNMTNTAKLFVWNNVSVLSDVGGTPIIVTDLLPVLSAPVRYNILGLTAGGIVIEQNDDYAEATETITGKQQIQYAYQNQWSFNLGLAGYAWNKTGGGASPTDAALGTASNWPQVATDIKDLAGVMLRSNQVAV